MVYIPPYAYYFLVGNTKSKELITGIQTTTPILINIHQNGNYRWALQVTHPTFLPNTFHAAAFDPAYYRLIAVTET